MRKRDAKAAAKDELKNSASEVKDEKEEEVVLVQRDSQGRVIFVS